MTPMTKSDKGWKRCITDFYKICGDMNKKKSHNLMQVEFFAQ